MKNQFASLEGFDPKTWPITVQALEVVPMDIQPARLQLCAEISALLDKYESNHPSNNDVHCVQGHMAAFSEVIAKSIAKKWYDEVTFFDGEEHV